MKIVFIAACIAVTSALVCKRCVDSDNSEFDAVIEGYSEFDKDIDVKKCSIQLILYNLIISIWNRRPNIENEMFQI